MLEDVEDWVRCYSPDEEKRIFSQLQEITIECHCGQYDDISLRWLCDMHYRLFCGVRDHAGKIRDRGYGNEHLVFGPNRSINRNEVRTELNKVFGILQRNLRLLETRMDDPSYEKESFHVAVWVHAEIIKIHPFLDGNGRSSRLVMNAVLVKLGFPPVSMDAVKQEYNLALNLYFQRQGIQTLLDLVLRLAAPD